MEFASDNTSGVAPEIMAALADASAGYAPAYGDDDLTRAMDARFADLFEHEVRVFPVISGTAANSLALSVLTPPWGLVLCHESAHIYTDEAGAPEFFSSGARLAPLPGSLGKIDARALRAAVARGGHGIHSSPATVLSLTQATEAGTVHTVDEVAERADIAAGRGLAVHMDGARFANALVSLDCTPAELTWRAGIDVLSFGATKNGAMGAEAVVFFDPGEVGELERHRKRAGHLISKMRYLSAQLLAYLDDDLWLANARCANTMAGRLSEGLAALEGVALLTPTEANEVFLTMPTPMVEGLRAQGGQFYVEDLGGVAAVRLVASFSTTDAQVDAFLDAAAQLS